MVGTLPIGILSLIFEKPFFRFCFLLITDYGQITADFVSFSGKNRFFIEFLGKSQPKTAKKKIAKRLFRNKALICRCGGSRPKCLVCRSFFIESLSKNIFEVGDPKNRRFWAFFQKSMSEISANWEKTCFSCCRFFRKIEEIGVYFGVRPNLFFTKNY